MNSKLFLLLSFLFILTTHPNKYHKIRFQRSLIVYHQSITYYIYKNYFSRQPISQSTNQPYRIWSLTGWRHSFIRVYFKAFGRNHKKKLEGGVNYYEKSIHKTVGVIY